MTTVSVVIVNYRTPDLTVAAAKCAFRAGGSDVVVVDNSAHDRALGVLTTVPRTMLVDLQMNEGFGAAANAGAHETASQYIAFMNSDAAITREALGSIVGELERWNGRAIVAPRLISPDGSIQRSAGLVPRPSDLAVRALGLHALGRWATGLPVVGALVRRTRLARDYASAETATDVINTDMVSGACFAIGREAFQELGGFDERFFMYFEDADLCRRAAAAGMPIRYVPSAVVTHIGGASSSEDYHFGPLHARSMRQYLGKWYGPGGSALAILLLWLRAVGFSVAFRPGAGRAWRALWAAVRDEDPRR